MCSCKAIAKIVLVAINFLFLLAGGLMLAFGIVAKVKVELIFEIFKYIPGMANVPQAFDLEGMISACAIFMIILGAVVFSVGFLGCFGACCESTFLLGIYLVLLILVLLAEVALIVLAAVYPRTLKDEIQKLMRKSLDNVREDLNITGNSVAFPTENEQALGWAILQLEADCCGAYNYTDYSAWNKTITIDGATYQALMPLSCCNKTKSVDYSKEKNYNISIFSNVQECMKKNETFINSPNCYDSVNQLIMKSLTIVIGIAAAIIAAELILIILAVCLCRQAGKDKTV